MNGQKLAVWPTMLSHVYIVAPKCQFVSVLEEKVKETTPYEIENEEWQDPEKRFYIKN